MYNRMTQVLVAALAVTALLLAGCDMQGNTGAKTTTSRSTPTPHPTLTWHQVTPPTGFSLVQTTMAISPVDGHDAWVCVPASTGAGSFTIWATRDAGTSWQQASALSLATPEPSHTCNLVVDKFDTRSLVAVVSWGEGMTTQRSMSALSNDGGAHWSPLPGLLLTRMVATSGGKIYASLTDTASTTSTGFSLAIITNENSTPQWHAITLAGLAPDDEVTNLWTHTPDGILFAATAHETFWRSADGGTSWKRVSPPNGRVELGTWLPQQGHWMFCAGTGLAVHVTCSADGGDTWNAPPTFTYTVKCGGCDTGTQTLTCSPIAIMSGGSLIAACPTSGSAQPDNAISVYRLASGATSWTVLGIAPSLSLTVTPTGQLWAIDQQAGTISVADMPL